MQSIEAAARSFASVGELASMGLKTDAEKLLVMRFDAARDLVWSLSSSHPTPCVFPYPTVKFQELLAWLLIDYWAVAGRILMSQKMFEQWNLDLNPKKLSPE